MGLDLLVMQTLFFFKERLQFLGQPSLLFILSSVARLADDLMLDTERHRLVRCT